MRVNKFVFVVCGARGHIDTLHYSLRYLKHFSSNEIIVVTDSRRNEIPVEHDNVVDIVTPKHFTHHQASIYLKVGLHKFLPKGTCYCYLDTDVIALSKQCDEIFNYKAGPITFAADHCPMAEFSPHAVNCGCIEKSLVQRAELESLILKYDPAQISADPAYLKKKNDTLIKFEAIKGNKLKNLLVTLRFNLFKRDFKLDEDTIYDHGESAWVDKDRKKIFWTDTMEEGVMKNSIFKWDEHNKIWLKPNGRDVYSFECNHLKEYIYDLWNIQVDPEFKHWNGGVFLFDDNSSEFLETWFNKTMQIFDLPKWRTRDQGTLIATVWEMGLQSNPVLPVRFNFIADATNAKVQVDSNGNFTLDGFKTSMRPVLIHIFHSFGKKGWPVWDYVANLGFEK